MSLALDKEEIKNIAQYSNSSSDIVDNIYQSFSLIKGQIGEIRLTADDGASFSAKVEGEWLLCDGGDCTGTEYATEFSVTEVPDFSANAISLLCNVLIRVN